MWSAFGGLLGEGKGRREEEEAVKDAEPDRWMD